MQIEMKQKKQDVFYANPKKNEETPASTGEGILGFPSWKLENALVF